MSEQLLIGAYINPQDAACGQSLDITHHDDEYCSTGSEMSSVERYRRARHVAAEQTRVCGTVSDQRLHVKLGSVLFASIGGRSVIFGHLDATS
jgi:hypothetical protein